MPSNTSHAEPLPVITIEGEEVALGPVNPDHFAAFNRWENDPRVVRNLGYSPRPRPLAVTTAAFQTHDPPDTTRDVFALYERATWRLIGNAGLIHIDYGDRTAEFFIVIGEADARGKGYGTEATMLVLDYAFVALGLHNVMLRVSAYNRAGIRAYEKAGFRMMGVRRQSKWMGGRQWDTVYMDCLASEFTSPVLARVFAPDAPRE